MNMEIVHSKGWRTKRAIKAEMVEQGNKIINMRKTWRRRRKKESWEEIKSLGIKKEKLRERIHIKKGSKETAAEEE